jgi:hypothetical protein
LTVMDGLNGEKLFICEQNRILRAAIQQVQYNTSSFKSFFFW